MANQNKRVAEFFKNNPNREKVYTAGEFLFYNKQDASAHAKTVKGKVQTFSNTAKR